MTCAHTFTRANGTERRCPDPATDTGYCRFHSVDWEAHYAATDAEQEAYAEETGGRNLFLDRFTGRVK